MDITVLSPDDPQDKNKYPLLTAKPNPRRVVCKACSIHSAKVIFDDFCKKLFKLHLSYIKLHFSGRLEKMN